MDKKLEKAKKEIQRQNLMMSFINIASLLSLINVDRLTRGYENHDLASIMTFFYLGLIVISSMIILFYLVRNLIYAKDEKALLRIYNEMHDERMAKVGGIVAKRTLTISIIPMVAVSVMLSYINVYMFIGSVIMVILLSLIFFACKIYYGKNYTDEA
ncbi:MAG: hypothetical protein HXL95_05855 [[Eubacterium] sulci]|nr:hypothetical protein [[Eubacterium] sulci]